VPIARRYDIHLPLAYNDGRRIEQAKFERTVAELVGRFGGLTGMRAEGGFALAGFWVYEGQLYEDAIITYTVYTLDVNPGDEFMRGLKPELKKRFRQKDILVVAQIVELF